MTGGMQELDAMSPMMGFGVAGDLVFTIRTTAPNQTFELPINNWATSGNNVNFTVAWGDGSSNTITSNTDSARIHTYAVAGDYEIAMVGTCASGFAFGWETGCLKVIQVRRVKGDMLGLTNALYMFSGCENLTTIMAGCFDSCTGFTASGFESTFNGCTSLTTIPIDLFRYNTAVSMNGFDETFDGCTSLTTIPTDLFKYNTVVSTSGFLATFRGCTSLTTIPTDLFRYNTAVSTNWFQQWSSG